MVRVLLRPLSAVLIIAGVGLTLYPLVRIVYTASQSGPIQAAALAEWEHAASGRPAPGSSTHRDVSEAPRDLVLTIPRLRLTRYVPEGAQLDQLRKFGVGRISWTVLPDRPGTVGIAGHRTTYGAPFFRLGELGRGDRIVITYGGKRFDYTVTDRRIVRPSAVEVLREGPDEYAIALITCTPLFSARYRLVVLGRLDKVSPLALTK